MNPNFETLRQVALSSENECLDLKVFCADIALTLEQHTSFDVEDGGRLIWIVGDQDATWAVSMPGSRSDVEALSAAQPTNADQMRDVGMSWYDFA